MAPRKRRRKDGSSCFDPGKEHIGILSTTEPVGDNFKLLGVEIDAKLRMNGAISACAIDVSWRMRSLLRTSRFYNDAELVLFFKAHARNGIILSRGLRWMSE